MVKCELCGRLFKTPQGRRGHMTFKHGKRARGKKPEELGKNSLNKYNERLARLTKEIRSNNETLEDLNVNLRYLQHRMLSLAFREEVRRVAIELDGLKDQVEKHSRWFNPHGLHEAVLDLFGGPIADIEKRLKGRKSFVK